MTRRLIAGCLAVTAFVMLLLEVPLGIALVAQEHDRLVAAIERDARVLAASVDDAFEDHPIDDRLTVEDIQHFATAFASQTGGRAVVVDETGHAIADSAGRATASAPIDRRDFSNRPEIAAALRGRSLAGTRTSTTLGARLVYVAVPIIHENTTLGAVRVTYPAASIDARARSVWGRLLALDAIVAMLAALVSWFIASGINRPLRKLGDVADALAAGDLTARTPASEGPPEVRRLAGQFDAMAERIERLVSLQRAFVADASHQLRTPLMALRLRLDALADSEHAPRHGSSGGHGHGDDAGDIDAALAEVDRLNALVDGLLAMARIESGTATAVPVDLDAAAAERVRTWSALAEERGITLSTHGIAGCALAVNGAVEQILDNLISNALDASPDGGSIRVELAGGHTSKGRPSATLRVDDDGPGFTAEQAERAFDRFWRGAGAPAGGTGLGLAIVRELAVTSGGDASVRVDADGGSVIVTLPVPAGTNPGDSTPRRTT